MKKIFLHIILMVITATIYCQNVYLVTKTTDPDPFAHKFDNIDSLCDPEMYGTLQWAINKVNNNSGDNRIEFNIPGTGAHEIILNYYLPQIKNATIIDGSTQNGYNYGNPQIIINAQYKHNSIFDVYSTNITIKGLKLTSFAQNGILLHDCSNSLITENIIYNYSTIASKNPYTGLFINGGQNVEAFGNTIEIALDETVDEKTKSYGVYLSKSFNCTIGGTDTNLANTIKNCRNYGVLARGSQNIKISGNIIFGCEKAIYLDASNDNIQPPEISEYTNGILSGTALPNSTIEVFGSTGAENANEYLASVIADENGDWGVDISSELKYFISTQTSSLNNTSMLSNSFINPRTTQLLAMFQNADSVDLDDFLYAKKINGAIKYQFNVMQVDSGVNQIITKDVNFISLLELENNEAYYDKEYKIKVRAIFEEDTAEWGEECTILTINEQKYKYGIVHLRILPEYNNLITPFTGTENSTPIFIEGFSELNSLLQVNTIEKTFPRVLNKLPDLFNIYTIYFNEAFSTDSLINWANQTGYFEYASNYPIYKLFEGVNDQYYNNPPSPTECAFCENNLGQWSLQQLNAEEAWDLIDNENVIKIAIVDDAVRYDHIDLHDNIYINTNEIPDDILSLLLSDYDINDNNLVDANEFVKYCKDISSVDINNLHDVMNNQSALSTIFNNIDDDQNGYIDDIIGWDASHNDNDPYPGIIPEQGEVTFAHGTHVAGISSAVTNNNEGIASLSLNRTRIIPVKIYIDSNSGSSLNNPYEGVEYAIAAGADIVNMSWGVEWTNEITNYPLYSLINTAHNNLGITFIAAMGNNGIEQINAPACIPEVVAVGATTSNQKIADFSTIGAHMDFFAPGAEILSSYSAGANNYCCMNGTSMACPLVSALWALMKSMNPYATFNEIYNCISSTCIIPEHWATDCSETEGSLPWSSNISKNGIINPIDAVSCLKQLPPVANFEHVGNIICPDTEFYFYSTSSGGPISSIMKLEWSCSDPDVIFGTPNESNTTITFPNQENNNIYEIVFTIYNEDNVEISHCNKLIQVAYPKVGIINNNFESCYGFETTMFLHFAGTPPFSFNYNINDGEQLYVTDIQSQEYILLVNHESLNLDLNSINITNVKDAYCTNSDDTFTFNFKIIECDLCSRNHNNIMTWRGKQMQFFPENAISLLNLPIEPYAESSCAITNNDGKPLLLMKGDYLYNLTTPNNNLITNTGSEFGLSSKEGSLILPHDTGNPNWYYAIVVDDNSNNFPESLRYYLIDVSNTNGMQILDYKTFSNNDSEIIIACNISDDYGYWILTNKKSSNQINLYKLQNNSLEFIGAIETQHWTQLSPMCLSPDMHLLAVKKNFHATSIYQLNRNSDCILEDRLNLITTIEHYSFVPYYYEFSPNSQLLYITGAGSGLKLLQYPIYNHNNTPTHTIEAKLTDMRLGHDNIIYIELIDEGVENKKISVIKSPNIVGSDCAYQHGYYDTGITGVSDLSRRIPIIPFNFNIIEEEVDCQVNLVIDNLTGYEPFTYLWNDNSTNNYLNNVGLGEYSVTITDTYGCSLDRNYNVTTLNHAVCNISLIHNVCFGTTNTGRVDFSIAEGTAPYVVELIAAGTVIETQNFNASGLYSFENIGANDYTIRVTDHNGCQDEVFFTISVTNEIIATITEHTDCICYEELNGSATVTANGGVEPYSYFWDDEQNSTSQTITNLSAGVYNVTVTDEIGCDAYASITINGPSEALAINVEHTDINCYGGTSTVTITATGGTEPYLGTGTFIVSAGTHLFTVTDANSCTANTSVTIDSPTQIVLEVNTLDISCYGDNNGLASIYAYGGIPEYQYNIGYGWQTNNEFENLIANHTYTVTVQDANGCTVTTPAFVLTEPPAITVSYHINNTSYCSNNCDWNITAIGTGGTGVLHYTWFNGESTTYGANISNICDGNYYLTITDENECILEDVYTLSSDFASPEVPELEIPSCLFKNSLMSFTDIANSDPSLVWNWTIGGVTITDDNQLDYTFNDYGYYCISVTVGNDECGYESCAAEQLFVHPGFCSCDNSEFELGYYSYDYTDGYTIPTGVNEVWQTTNLNEEERLFVEGDIIIEPNASLTIGELVRVEFAPNGRIIVKAGAKLTIERDVTLTNLYFPPWVQTIDPISTNQEGENKFIPICENNMWQGIEVWGDPDNIHNVGIVEITEKESVLIENAHIGILAGARNMDYLCDNVANPNPFDESKGCGIIIIAESDIEFRNNGIGIKFLPRPNYVVGTLWSGNILNDCIFRTISNLYDPHYLSSLPNPYPNPQNPWAGYANPYQRTDVGVYINGIQGLNINECMFHNMQYGILSYDAKYNVFKSNFTKMIYGIKMLNTHSSVINNHEIAECYFDNIPGFQATNFAKLLTAAIHSTAGYNDYIHNNTFGLLATNQKFNHFGIVTSNSSMYEITENLFRNFDCGIVTTNTGLNGGFIGAESNQLSVWNGNRFLSSWRSITTQGNNPKLQLKCNRSENNEIAENTYNVNYLNTGTLANQGKPTPSLYIANKQRYPAGNEFLPKDYDEFKTIKSNSPYTYYRHTGPLEVIPVLDPTSQAFININSTNAVFKISNEIACPEPVWGHIFEEQISLPDIKPSTTSIHMNYPFNIIDSLQNSIDSLILVRNNLSLNLDNGKTIELLSDIYGNMAQGKLKNKLISHSPLSDTVLFALMSEYPLSHGNFKNVMMLNLPVNQNLENLLYTILTQIPQDIAKQLIEMQAYNPFSNTQGKLEQEIKDAELEKQLLLNRFIRILSDTIHNRHDDVISLLEAEQNFAADKILTGTYISIKDYQSAENKLTTIPDVEKEYQDFKAIYNLLMPYYNQNKTLYELDSTDLEFLRAYAYDCPLTLAGANAQSILSLLYREEFEDCPPAMETKTIKTFNAHINAPDDVEDFFLGDNYPDPADDYTIIPYKLEEKTGVLEISDASGKIISIYNINSTEQEFKLNTQNLVPGIYNYTIISTNGTTATKKFAIYR